MQHISPKGGIPLKSKSVETLAEDHDLCKGTIYNEIARGNLRTIKVGRRRLITADQEAQWLRKCEGIA